ncbi:DUF84 family protein [Pseudalkalibacillus salsuginis]|uniref:DUF84 family protein n=1 Tax=Pseudalkalibacillus salsuginis TaxID=2910972 RepID=UPI001F3588A5|nr:DUF84 family protein [Pseudalkalibacillus salsuginis]MCF6408826.1 DUF84 family protein [Pseudalkalibacillus salsuginis]
MIVAVGSKNPAKVQAVRLIVETLDWQVEGMDAPSLVSPQPFSDPETRKGAINRAKACVNSGYKIGIGLEGGVVDSEAGLFLCNWGALVTEKLDTYVVSGAKILLPKEIGDLVRSGRELGDVMADYTNQKNIRKKEGAIGIFTDGWITREEMFAHIVRLLIGQYQFYKKRT